MKILNDIPIEIDSDEVFETLHLKAQHRYAGEVRALIDKAREFARPRAVYEVAFVEERETRRRRARGRVSAAEFDAAR